MTRFAASCGEPECKGTRFARALKRENLSQSDVARALGVTHQSVNEWATGKRPIPRGRQIEMYSRFPFLLIDLKETPDAQG